jgi:hypothetical protein
MTITGTERLRIGDLISRRVPFKVPIYQRGYAWETEEVDDFISDLRTLYEMRRSNPSQQQDHFFGGLVSVERFAGETTTGRVYEVVDGQQRLATFLITIYLLVERFDVLARQAQRESDPDTKIAAEAYTRETEYNYLRYVEVEAGHERHRLRLTLSKADQFFFEQLMDKEIANPATERKSHERLKSAWRRIRRDLINEILGESTCAADGLARLLSLRSCITDDCHVIHIVSNDRREAYRLFTVLNDRGRTLSDGDLLRSHTLEMLEGHENVQRAVEQYWDHILAGSQTEIDNFLRSYFPSHVGERAPQRDLFDHFRDEFFNGGPSHQVDAARAISIQTRVVNMSTEIDTFAILAEGEWPYDNTTVSMWERDRLYRLVKVLKHTLCLPLLLSAARNLDEQLFSDIVNVLERFVFRYITVIRAHAGSLAEQYYENATRIRQNPENYRLSIIEEDLRRLLISGAQDNLFASNLAERLIYTNYSPQKRIIKHFLTTLEDYYTWFRNGANGRPRPETMSAFDLNEISIEHIYPQNPPLPIAELEPLKHHIGNLTFWAPRDNSGAGNEPFSSKRALYAESYVKLTSELADLTEWSTEELSRRQQRLISMALKIFTV